MILKEYLTENGIGQKWFARKIGISYPTLNNIFKGLKVSKPIAIAVELQTKGEIKAIDIMRTEKKKKKTRQHPVVLQPSTEANGMDNNSDVSLNCNH